MKGISDLLDSDMEDVENIIDENSILSSASDASAVAPANRKTTLAKKPRKRKPVTMPKTKSRVTKIQAESTAKKTAKAASGAKRKALEEQVNGGHAKTESVSGSEDELESPHILNQKTASKSKRKITQRTTGEPEEVEVEQTPLVARSSHAQTKSSKPAPKVVKKAAVPRANPVKKVPEAIAETQIEQEYDSDEDVRVVREPAQRFRQTSIARTGSRRPQDGTTRRRAGSVSDTERGDPNLRRKLGDITLKFENIDLKYRNLKEVGIHEATTNAEKMRKQCEIMNQKSVDLITSLKAELAMKAPLAHDTRKMAKELQFKDSEMIKLQEAVSDLTRSLADAQNEIKALHAKLSASRSTPVEGTNTKTPGSAARNPIATRTIVGGSAEAAQAAQMKEDIYSDLTGLIIRSVKKTPEGDAYDCIQTGRNGSKYA